MAWKLIDIKKEAESRDKNEKRRIFVGKYGDVEIYLFSYMHGTYIRRSLFSPWYAEKKERVDSIEVFAKKNGEDASVIDASCYPVMSKWHNWYEDKPTPKYFGKLFGRDIYWVDDDSENHRSIETFIKKLDLIPTPLASFIRSNSRFSYDIVKGWAELNDQPAIIYKEVLKELIINAEKKYFKKDFEVFDASHNWAVFDEIKKEAHKKDEEEAIESYRSLSNDDAYAKSDPHAVFKDLFLNALNNDDVVSGPKEVGELFGCKLILCDDPLQWFKNGMRNNSVSFGITGWQSNRYYLHSKPEDIKNLLQKYNKLYISQEVLDQLKEIFTISSPKENKSANEDENMDINKEIIETGAKYLGNFMGRDWYEKDNFASIPSKIKNPPVLRWSNPGWARNRERLVRALTDCTLDGVRYILVNKEISNLIKDWNLFMPFIGTVNGKKVFLLWHHNDDIPQHTKLWLDNSWLEQIEGMSGTELQNYLLSLDRIYTSKDVLIAALKKMGASHAELGINADLDQDLTNDIVDAYLGDRYVGKIYGVNVWLSDRPETSYNLRNWNGREGVAWQAEGYHIICNLKEIFAHSPGPGGSLVIDKACLDDLLRRVPSKNLELTEEFKKEKTDPDKEKESSDMEFFEILKDEFGIVYIGKFRGREVYYHPKIEPDLLRTTYSLFSKYNRNMPNFANVSSGYSAIENIYELYGERNIRPVILDKKILHEVAKKIPYEEMEIADPYFMEWMSQNTKIIDVCDLSLGNKKSHTIKSSESITLEKDHGYDGQIITSLDDKIDFNQRSTCIDKNILKDYIRRYANLFKNANIVTTQENLIEFGAHALIPEKYVGSWENLDFYVHKDPYSRYPFVGGIENLSVRWGNPTVFENSFYPKFWSESPSIKKVIFTEDCLSKMLKWATFYDKEETSTEERKKVEMPNIEYIGFIPEYDSEIYVNRSEESDQYAAECHGMTYCSEEMLSDEKNAKRFFDNFRGWQVVLSESSVQRIMKYKSLGLCIDDDVKIGKIERPTMKTAAKNTLGTLASSVKTGGQMAAAAEFNQMSVDLVKIALREMNVPNELLEHKGSEALLHLFTPYAILMLTAKLPEGTIPGDKYLRQGAEHAISAETMRMLMPILGKVRPKLKELVTKAKYVSGESDIFEEGVGDDLEEDKVEKDLRVEDKIPDPVPV